MKCEPLPECPPGIVGAGGARPARAAGGARSAGSGDCAAAGNTAAATNAVVIDPVANASFAVGAGATIVLGQAGDKITAGTGPDTFVFHAGFGAESITGFATSGSAADVLQFDKSEFADWAHLLGATKQVGANLQITLDASDVLTLKNITLASFTSSSAHFV